LGAFAPFADEPWALLLLSGLGGRWSYIVRAPRRTEQVTAADGDRDFARLRALLGPRAPAEPDGPPFQGGVVGVAAYEFAQRLEPLPLPRDPDWPDLMLARFEDLLAFDHHERQVWTIGDAAAWLATIAPAHGACAPAPAAHLAPAADPADYETAVGDVVARIHVGEIFQANIARRWQGRLAPGARPFDAFARLARTSPAPFAAYWRLPGLALVSHSPERFLSIGPDATSVTAEPIKGTRPRGANVAEDEVLAAELLASAKDRAENLMIVDLMRNDLARVCQPGSVAVPKLCALGTFPAVHHLVSTVTGRLRPGTDAADLMAAAFPPGSITGAPKVQAMKVIAAHEPPRGPWCGSLFWAGHDGAFDSSVLIRTAAFAEDALGWRFRYDAGAGIVAESEPAAERAETEVKAAGLRRALAGAWR
jgi:para-aminobenzoate synthetase component 1